MITIIVDPGLFEIEQSSSIQAQMEHVQYLQTTLEFVSRFFNSALDSYEGAPYIPLYTPDFSAPPITSSLTLKNVYATKIKPLISRMLKNGNTLNPGLEKIETISLRFVSDSQLEPFFRRYIYTILSPSFDSEKYVLVLSEKNRALGPKVAAISNNMIYEIHSIENPSYDCSGLVSGYLNSVSDFKIMFPQKDACALLNDAFLKEKSATGENIPLFIKYGNEVANRNGYRESPALSRKNNNHHVFNHPHADYLISIDCEHGGIEVFVTSRGQAHHLGEFDYSCNKKKEAEPETHKLFI